MPNYPWLEGAALDGSKVTASMTALTRVGVPYSADELKNAAEEVKGKTELDALVAYLQVLGTAGNK
jgi:cytochrome c oxidase cbb3-type subunit 2